MKNPGRNNLYIYICVYIHIHIDFKSNDYKVSQFKYRIKNATQQMKRGEHALRSFIPCVFCYMNVVISNVISKIIAIKSVEKIIK